MLVKIAVTHLRYLLLAFTAAAKIPEREELDKFIVIALNIQELQTELDGRAIYSLIEAAQHIPEQVIHQFRALDLVIRIVKINLLDSLIYKLDIVQFCQLHALQELQNNNGKRRIKTQR